ncbi:MAG TPA: ATP-binding protein [Tepidisphaeraceae bacterium]|nr:ATP-binding protein [Tepidisphaeraceae bacterium]
MDRRQKNQSLNEYLKVGEAAEFLGVSPWTLRNWDRSGKLKSIRHPKNGYRIYRHEDLAAILKLETAGLSSINESAAPRADWSITGESEHFVQFYESDSFLTDSVSGFIGSALVLGHGALVIATESHRQAIEAKLVARGMNVSAAAGRGKYVALDASETLAKLMADGTVDATRFNHVVGQIVRLISEKGVHLRAFGEMVALLWNDGNREAAVRLEELWNGLATRFPFSLFCAYPMQKVAGNENAEAFAKVCSCHSRVLPSESYSTLSKAEERLRAISQLQQKAQSLEAEIAHRQEVEKALIRRERELADFFENALEGLHQLSADGTILWANRVELELLGYAAQEFIGHHISEFYVDPSVVDHMLATLMSGRHVFEQPSQLRCKDGSIRQFVVHANPYFHNGRFVHVRCFMRDVTDQKRAEQNLNQIIERERAARAEAERVSRMKDEFLNTISHELRTPLQAIFGWSQIMKRSPDDAATVAQGISVIDRNVRNQTRLIEELLDLGRIISGKIRLEFQEFDLAPIIRTSVRAVQSLADAKNIQISQDIDSANLSVRADPARVHQMLWNLLTNAIKFTPSSGRISVGLKPVDSRAEISVTDTGQGIDADFLPHVFDRFRQADSSITRSHGGLGIGLSLVKQLVELQGGAVSATSEGSAKGSTFTIAIPMVQQSFTPVPPAATISLQSS